LSESGCHGLTGDLGIVARLGFGGRDIADGLEEAPVVEPVDPFQGGKLDCFDAAPRTAPADHLGLEQADNRLGKSVDAPMSVKQFLTPAAAACKDG
jgi:hypothetical protein